MKKPLLLLLLVLAGLLALKLWLTPAPGRGWRIAVPLVRKSREAPASPKRVSTVPAQAVAHRR